MGSPAWSDQEQINYGYELLQQVAPITSQFLPSRYAQASAQLSVITARLPQATLARRTIEARVEKSADPLNQLIDEADASENAPYKDDLLRQAGQMAFTQGKLKMAVDLFATTTSKGRLGMLRDKFLIDVVSKAVQSKDAELAAYAASKLSSNLRRAFAAQKIALYFFGIKDSSHAREYMNDAIKFAQDADNDAGKAAIFLTITQAFIKIDESKVMETARLAVKVINNIPRVASDSKPDAEARKAYVDSLLNIASDIPQVFHHIAQKNEFEAHDLADKIELHDLRAAAIFGTYMDTLTMRDGAILTKQKK